MEFCEWSFNKRLLVLMIWCIFLLWVGYDGTCSHCGKVTKSEIRSDGLPHCLKCQWTHRYETYESSGTLITIFSLMGYAFCFKKELIQGYWDDN